MIPYEENALQAIADSLPKIADELKRMNDLRELELKATTLNKYIGEEPTYKDLKKVMRLINVSNV